MNWATVGWIALLLVLVLLPFVGIARWAWRLFVRETEEMEPGGSLGRQYLGGAAERFRRSR